MEIEFAEELVLFLTSPPPVKKGELEFNLPNWVDLQLDFYASVGLFLELYLKGNIVIVDEKVEIKGTPKGDNELETLVINKIIESAERRSPSYWINYFCDIDYPNSSPVRFEVFEKIVASLKDKNLLRVENKKYLFIFNSTVTKTTELGLSITGQKVEEIKKALNSGNFDLSHLILILMLGEGMAEVFPASYLSKEESNKLALLVKDQEFMTKNKEAYELLDRIKKSFSSKTADH